MVNFPTVLENMYNMILNNQEILKLLYYDSTKYSDDPLSKADLPLDVAAKRIKKVPTDFIIDAIGDNEETVKRGYITIFMDDYNSMDNPLAMFASMRIEIYMPIRGFEEWQFRTASIVTILNNMFLQKRVDGSIGRLILDSSFNISRPADGYMAYAHVYSAGDMTSGTG